MERKIAVDVVVDVAASSDHILNIVGYVHGTIDVDRLHSQARLVGIAVGPSNGSDAMTVQLSVAEIAVGVTEDHLQLVTTDDTVDAEKVENALRCLVKKNIHEEALLLGDAAMRLRVRVFVDLWKRGHFVAFGSKFGVDFLVYEAHPATCHSFAMIVIKDYTAQFATVDIVSHCRVAKMVKKMLFIASQQNEELVYLSLDHAILATAQPERR